MRTREEIIKDSVDTWETTKESISVFKAFDSMNTQLILETLLDIRDLLTQHNPE